MEDDVKELEVVNKRLKEELKNYKKKVRHSSKGDIRDFNGWTGDEAILTNKVTEFSRDYMFPCYKFLKEIRIQRMKRACHILLGRKWLIHTEA